MPEFVHSSTLPWLPSPDEAVMISGAGALRESPDVIQGGQEIAFGVVQVVTGGGRPIGRQAVGCVTSVAGAASIVAAILDYADRHGVAHALAAEIDQARAEYDHQRRTVGYRPPPGEPGSAS